jgi:hypothetical protein
MAIQRGHLRTQSSNSDHTRRPNDTALPGTRDDLLALGIEEGLEGFLRDLLGDKAGQVIAPAFQQELSSFPIGLRLLKPAEALRFRIPPHRPSLPPPAPDG